MNDEIDPLTRLAIKHGTDKWGVHFYTPHYHEVLSRLRDQPVRLLEIGVGGYDHPKLGGNSLAMWAEYFTQGEIVGIDIQKKELDLGPRVTVLQGAQDDPAFLSRVNARHGPFDIVIDDGSHVPKHVAASFYALFPLLRNPGLYIIEDVQTAFWPQFGGSSLDGGATMSLASTILGHIQHAERVAFDRKMQLSPWAKEIRSFRSIHNVFFIEKGDNSEPSNAALGFDNPHVRRSIEWIERQMAAEPTAAGMANLVSVCLQANERDRALGHLEAAERMWPDDPAIRHIAGLTRAASPPASAKTPA